MSEHSHAALTTCAKRGGLDRGGGGGGGNSGAKNTKPNDDLYSDSFRDLSPTERRTYEQSSQASVGDTDAKLKKAVDRITAQRCHARNHDGAVTSSTTVCRRVYQNNPNPILLSLRGTSAGIFNTVLAEYSQGGIVTNDRAQDGGNTSTTATIQSGSQAIPPWLVDDPMALLCRQQQQQQDQQILQKNSEDASTSSSSSSSAHVDTDAAACEWRAMSFFCEIDAALEECRLRANVASVEQKLHACVIKRDGSWLLVDLKLDESLGDSDTELDTETDRTLVPMAVILHCNEQEMLDSYYYVVL